MDHYVMHTADFTGTNDVDEKDALLKKGPEQFATFVFLKNSEQRKYGKLLSNLKEQYALGNDQYPKKLERAIDALNNHKWDEAWSKHQNNKRQNRKENCKRREEETSNNTESHFVQSGNKKLCYCCGKSGHIAPDCPERETRKKNDWYM